MRQHGLKTLTVSLVFWAIPSQSTDTNEITHCSKCNFSQIYYMFPCKSCQEWSDKCRTNHQSWWDKWQNWCDICPTSSTLK